MTVITPDHMGGLSAWLATLFHQSKLVVACLYLPLWVGVQIKLVRPCYVYLNSTLGEHEQVIKETRI